ncbi:MAG: hypothetical protein NVSMB24_16210 [Mucilaginibacter sp.]
MHCHIFNTILVLYHNNNNLNLKTMDMYQNPYMNFPGITPEEMGFLQQATADLSENQKRNFI